MPTTRSGSRLAGRERERETIEGFLRGLPTDGAGALVIGGEPGIGKTTLWRFATDRAAALGAQVLVTRPAEEEMPMSGVGLVDLFERADPDLKLSFLDDPFSTGRVVLESLRGLIDRGPVVIAIDDLQWLDSVTARALRYSLRRFRVEAVAVVATLRSDTATSDPLSVPTTLPPDRIAVVEPGPLGLEELRRAIGGTVATISRPALRRLHDASRGNPMLAIELARSDTLGRDETTVGTRGSDPLRIAIGRRIAGVSEEQRALLEMISVLGRTRVDRLRAMMAPHDVDALISTGEQEGLVVTDDDRSVRLSHPVIGSVVYSGIEVRDRRGLHALVAENATDPDDRARHLALSAEPPDPEVAHLLDEAAERANRRGASDLAAELARHSLRLTPVDDESELRRRELAEINYLALAGEARRALEAADRLVAALPHGPDRAAVLIQRFEVEDDDLELGDELLSGALEDVGTDDLLRCRVLDMLAWLRGMYRGDLQKGMRCAREGLEIAERVGDPHLLMITGSSLALLGALAGEPDPERLAHAVALEREQVEGGPSEGPLAISGKIRFWEGDLPEARRSFEEALAAAARSGNELTRPYRLYDLSLLACAEGDLAASLELARLGIEAAEDAEFPIGSLQYPFASAQAWLGEAEASRSTAGVLLEWAERRGERPGIVRAHMVLGLLSLSEGAAALAAEHLRRAAGMIDDMGVEHPGAFPVLPDAIEAEARAGETERAEALLARLERQVSRTEGAWAAAALDRSRGALRLALGDPDAAFGPLEAADRAFSLLGYRPDAARALLLLGTAALRAGHRTRAAGALTQARERFEAMGASLWEERAMAELERVAPRAGAELTATEGRVAAAVIEGMKNREIAQAMFVSLATVEAHLTRIYRKLGIRSRGELIRFVTDGTVELGRDEPGPGGGTPA